MNERFKARKARVAELERELDLLRKRRKALEKDLTREEPEEDWAPRKSAAPRPPSPPAGAAPAASPESRSEWEAPHEGEDRERFAHYFMSGGLGRTGPRLRGEMRALRNKAIVAAVFALLCLIALVAYLMK